MDEQETMSDDANIKWGGKRYSVLRTVFHEAESVTEFVVGPSSRPRRGPDDTLSLFALTDANGLPAGSSMWPSMEEALAERAMDRPEEGR